MQISGCGGSSSARSAWSWSCSGEQAPGPEEQSAATEQVSASTEEMSAQVEEMSAQAQELAETAEQLKELVTRFKLDDQAGPVVALERRPAAHTGAARRHAA
jgi:hypothetical protein